MTNAPRFCSSCGQPLAPGARFCGQCGAAVAAPAPDAPSDAAERRQACVLFADLSGFTALSRRVDPEEVRALLERFFAITDGVVRDHGGGIDKHVGDAVMAVFGAPVSHGNDAERAVRAALAMHEAVAELHDPDGVPLAIHVGIAAGEIVAGRTGSAHHSAYTVTGPAANLAARLLERSGPGETVIPDSLRAVAERIATLSPLGEAELKGIGPPTRLWRLGERIASPQTAAAPLFGRDAERAQLASLLDLAAGGAGQVVLLRGDPGIGKTRLVEEALALAERGGVRCVRAAILDFGVERGGDAARVVARALATIAKPATEEHRPALDDLLDRPRDAESARAWDAMTQAVREGARGAALAALVAAAAAAAPLLITIEDLHWADPDTLARVAAIAAAARGRRVAVLLSTRVDGDPVDRAWRAAVGPTQLTAIDLAALDSEAAFGLARSLAGEAGDAARAWVERAEGNPLFLIELARNAVETQLPDSVQSVVQARIDRLAPADKLLVQCASVAGQRVDPALLAHLVEREAVDCARLLEAGLLRPHPDGGLLFGHALILEGVYATLLRARRRALHARAASFFAGRDVALEARHLDLAEDPGAADAYRRAASAAHGEGRIAEAIAHAERGLALATEQGARAALALLRAEGLLELGRAAEAEQGFRSVLEPGASDRDRCGAWIGIAACMRLLSRVDEALAALEEADAARAESPSLLVEAARTRSLRGNLRFARGEVELCRLEHEATLELARRAGRVDLEARALNGLGDAVYAAGRMRSALAAFEHCRALCREHGLGRLDQANGFMIGHCLMYMNEASQGLAVLERAAADSIRAGNRLGEMQNIESAGILLCELGRDHEAITTFERALALSRELGSRRYDAIILAVMALSLARIGREGEAERAATEAVQITEETSPGFCGGLARGALAELASDEAVARDALARGEALLARGCVGHNYLWFYRSGMRFALRVGDDASALRYATALEAYTAAEPLPWADLHIARTRAALSGRT